MNRILICWVVLLLGGCADLTPADYWVGGGRYYPDAAIQVHYIEPSAFVQCGDGTMAVGCARRDPEACHIFLRSDYRGDGCALSHEVKHCRGWDHPRYPAFQHSVCGDEIGGREATAPDAMRWGWEAPKPR